MIEKIANMCKEKSNERIYYELRLDFGDNCGVIFGRDKMTDFIKSDYWFDIDSDNELHMALHYISQ